MMASDNFRNPKHLSTDFYETNPTLVKLLIKVYKKYHKPGWLSVDPSVGRGVIFGQLNHPKRGLDISSKHLTKTNQYEVSDFLRSRPKAAASDPTKTIVVGNPPFRSNTRRQLYMDFVNHASTFADTVIFIVPMSALKYKNITRSKALALTHVYYVPKHAQCFENSNGGKVQINVCIQVYQRSSTPSFKLVSKKPTGDKKDFVGTHRIYNYPLGHFDFYVRRLDTPKSIGKVVTKYPYSRAYIKEHPNTTGWFGIRVVDRSKKAIVMRRFVQMYEKGEIYRHISRTSIGNWSDFNFYDVVKIFYGLLEKPNFREYHVG